MKALSFITFIASFFLVVDSFAQTPKQIETDLLKSFSRIQYWNTKRYESNDYHAEFEDSLNNANKHFAKKLKYYAEHYPATIMQDFISLKKARLDIETSDDNLFRIYSWDTEEGGTMHSFENVFQYKFGNRMIAVLDSAKEGDYCDTYIKVLTVKSHSQSYYIANTLFIESSRYYSEGIQVFAIANGKLNKHFKAIKTKSGMHSEVSYEYDLSSVNNMNKIPNIIFDDTQTIKLPIVDIKGRFTGGYITYKFTGKYFEEVSS